MPASSVHGSLQLTSSYRKTNCLACGNCSSPASTSGPSLPNKHSNHMNGTGSLRTKAALTGNIFWVTDLYKLRGHLVNFPNRNRQKHSELLYESQIPVQSALETKPKQACLPKCTPSMKTAHSCASPGAAVIAMDLNRIQGRGHHGVVALGKDTASSFQRLCESRSLLDIFMVLPPEAVLKQAKE